MTATIQSMKSASQTTLITPFTINVSPHVPDKSTPKRWTREEYHDWERKAGFRLNAWS
ncbi:MAG: hypothetical protein AAGD11_09730 [Planctomycetota bacterium]